ncbi:phospholipase ABHD3-like protein [Dinothrombium tinctorium]|uniref:Phospholipase ABHD3-like protein n=1 Tax=Dinothrombium tinctorium TaxID=1965070 RepID=A0A443QT69_9ACAR|nr:phospholipase ABHD3-like protein [Dinothrombium tinctorium]
MHHRGSNGMILTSPKITDFYDDEDVAEVVTSLKQKYPEAVCIAIGVSSGGYLVTRYLYKNGQHSKIDAAFVISSPFDFRAFQKNLTREGPNQRYSQLLASHYKEIIQKNFKLLVKTQSGKVNFSDVMQSCYFEEVYEKYVTKIREKHIDEIYKDLALRENLGLVKRPLLCLNAEDDFLSPGVYCFYLLHLKNVISLDLPLEEIKYSTHVAMIVTKNGGHCGFMDGFIPIQTFFAERVFESYLQSLQELGVNINKVLFE